jgi:large subunit ribosomal protein L25
MELTAQKRDILGKKITSLRKQGMIPAELYGHGVKNIHLTLDAKAFRKAYKEAGESTVVTLVVGKEKHPALIHDIQRDALSESVAHVDFYEVRMDEKIATDVQLEFVGESPAVKEFGGIVNKSMSTVKVEALPGDLPHSLRVDLSLLTQLNQSIYVKDLAVPKGVKVLVDAETAIASVSEKMAEEVAAPVAPVVDVSTVKVESEEKKAEREKEKTDKEIAK